ncbi:2410_t:CDS:2 [Entrophospora sp. SA101]|nr:2410_t:CDS:2 [Entrophospora sp. SA101]
MEEVLISQDYLDHLQREDDCSTSTTLQRRSGVWEFFDYDKQESKNGHRWATCFKCNMHWSQGRPVELEEHIALYCTTQVKEIIQFYSQIVAKRKGKGSQAVSSNVIQGIEPTKKKRKAATNQTLLSDFIESTKLTSQRENAINSSLLRAFIVCNIPFHTISNPYFIEALRQLRPAYNPPSCQLFSGSLLNLEIVKINQKLYSLMEKATNLTLASIAGRLWIKMGSKNRTKLDLLKAQLRQYACNETPYNETYVTNIDTPLRWWKTCGDGTKHNPVYTY